MGKSKTSNHELKKKQHAFCKGRHWKVDCPKLKKNMSKSEANIAQADDAYDSDSSGYSLSITPTVCFPDMSEWILDTGATYHICPKRE